MTLKHLEDFRAQIQAQILKHDATPAVPGQEILKLTGSIELHVGLNLMNQLISMEQAILQAPPGAVGPEI